MKSNFLSTSLCSVYKGSILINRDFPNFRKNLKFSKNLGFSIYSAAAVGWPRDVSKKKARRKVILITYNNESIRTQTGIWSRISYCNSCHQRCYDEHFSAVLWWASAVLWWASAVPRHGISGAMMSIFSFIAVSWQPGDWGHDLTYSDLSSLLLQCGVLLAWKTMS